MNKTGIEWCDYTWNPVAGCSYESDGCLNCYAEAISKRFALPWGRARFYPERLGEPGKLRKPSRIFVCSMGDIFHETVRTEWQDAVWRVMEECWHHTFIILTKRPEIALADLERSDVMGELGNVWVGVTVESQAMAEERIPLLLQLPAELRFVSVEPMLEPVTLRRVRFPTGVEEDVFETRVSARAEKWVRKLNGVEWVIAGPETGPLARPCENAWIEALAAESPCFFDKRKVGWTRRELPRGYKPRKWPVKKGGVE